MTNFEDLFQQKVLQYNAHSKMKLHSYIYNTKISALFCVFKDNKPRAISITRTIFRLNTNWDHAYENYKLNNIHLIRYNKHQVATKLIAHTPFSAWRVVSTHLRLNSPWRDDSRLLVIPYSCSRVSDYNSRIVMSNFED